MTPEITGGTTSGAVVQTTPKSFSTGVATGSLVDIVARYWR